MGNVWNEFSRGNIQMRVRAELNENGYKSNARSLEGSMFWALMQEGKDERHR